MDAPFTVIGFVGLLVVVFTLVAMTAGPMIPCVALAVRALLLRMVSRRPFKIFIWPLLALATIETGSWGMLWLPRLPRSEDPLVRLLPFSISFVSPPIFAGISAWVLWKKGGIGKRQAAFGWVIASIVNFTTLGIAPYLLIGFLENRVGVKIPVPYWLPK